MKRTEMYLTLARIPLYFLAAFAGWWIARAVRPITDLVPGLHIWFDPRFIPETEFFLPFSLLAAAGFLLITILLGSFRFIEAFKWGRETGRLLLASLFWGMGIISYFALVEREVIFSRMMLAQAMIFTLLLSLVTLLLLRQFQKILWRIGIGISRIILVGSSESVLEFQTILSTMRQFLIQRKYGIRENEINIDDADELWFVDRQLSIEQEKQLKNLCHQKHKIFRFVPGSDSAFARMEMDILGGIPLLRPVPSSLTGWGRICKRLIDLVLSLTLTIVLFPLMLLVVLGIKATSKGSIFYRSVRLGRDGKEFKIWKFRSMVEGADKLKEQLQESNHRVDGPFFKIKNDPRVTGFGKFMRRFSIDELPQLLNVIRGEMSLVGPRPHFPEEVEEFTPELRRILSIRPGITGLSQVSGRSDLSFAEEIRLDLFYLEKWSFWLDIKILFKTFGVVIDGEGAD